MAKLLIMDRTGHSEHAFDPKNVVSTQEAERRFNQLRGEGYTAAAKRPEGRQEVVKAFDPSVEEHVFYPRLQGG